MNTQETSRSNNVILDRVGAEKLKRSYRTIAFLNLIKHDERMRCIDFASKQRL